MALKTYTVTVASGDLYLGGGAQGNVFYLDGARNIDLKWVRGATLRFDQSASSNDNHPLFFATQTSYPQSYVYGTGVTYYLDGVNLVAKFQTITENGSDISSNQFETWELF